MSKNSLYPQVIVNDTAAISAASSSLYPTIDMKDLAEKLFPEDDAVADQNATKKSEQPHEEVLVRVPGAMVHLIERERSVELACGELQILSIEQGDTVVAVLARVGDDIKWPLTRDEAAVKLDESHYFFTLRIPGNEDESGKGGDDQEEFLNYGVTFASKGQEGLLKEFDEVLERYSSFSVQERKGTGSSWEVVARETSPEEFESKKELMDRSSAAYWTVLAPNVEDYSGGVAKLIAAGSGQLIRGILWCGDVTVDRLKWGNEFFKKRIVKSSDSEISPSTMRRIKRVKRLTKMSEKVAVGILSGVVKVSGFFTGSVVNSTVGRKFFSLLPGEIVLASLDGFNKVCDAVEVAGRSVMTTSSVVTTGLVSQRYGEEAAKVTHEGLGAAGHAFGTAWAVFKIRKALNPKSVLKPTTLVKAAANANANELKAKNKKK